MLLDAILGKSGLPQLPFSQQDGQVNVGQLMADQARAQSMGDLGQSLMQRGYAQNSGFAGALAQMAQSMIGMKMLKDSQAKMADVYSRQAQAQAQAAKAQHDQGLQDKAYENDLGTKRDAARIAAEASARSANDPHAKAFGMLSPEDQARAARIEAGLDPKSAGPRQPTEMDSKIAMLRQLGASPDQIKGMLLGNQAQGPFGDISAAVQSGVIKPEEAQRAIREKVGVETKPQPLTAEAKTKLALIDNAISNAQKYQSRVAGPNGEFRDVESMTGDTPQLIKSAVQDMLYAKSGASAPEGEVNKAMAMYTPSRVMGIPTERDSTASAKVQNFLNDMTKMRSEIAGNGQPAAQPATPAPNDILNELRRRGVKIGG